MKRVISVIVALVIVLSCLPIAASATVNDAVCKLEIKPTETTYSKGDEITFEVLIETTDELGLIGTWDGLSIGFDSDVFEVMEPVSGSLAVNYSDQTTNTVSVSGYPIEDQVIPSQSFFRVFGPANGTDTSTDRLNDNDKAKGWDSVFYTAQSSTLNENNGMLCNDDYSTQAANMAITLKIKSDAPDDGSYVVGITDYSIQGDTTMLEEELGSIYSQDAVEFGFTTSNIFELVDCTVSVSSASTGPVVDKSTAQVKMTPTSASTVDDEFQLRVISTITDDDYDTYFANSGDDSATTNAITELGMVAYKGDSFDYDTAVAAAKGTEAEGYTVGTTDYLSKTDTSAGTFGTIILLSHETCTNDVTYIGYVKYLDSTGAEAYAFYATQYTAAVSTNYDTIVSNYLAAYPYGA